MALILLVSFMILYQAVIKCIRKEQLLPEMVIIEDASVKVWKIFMQDMTDKYWEKVEPL